MQKILTFFFSKTISAFAILNDKSVNDTLTNDIVSFEQLGPGCLRQTNNVHIFKIRSTFFIPSLYNDTIHYNDNLTGIKPLLKR